jgi:L-histidine N-alpha-methyltransferase
MSTAVLTSPRPEIADEVRAGLSSRRKWLSPRLFYDTEGSRLFEQITRLPEYYLTRTERGILLAHAAGMAERAGTNLRLIELGAGTAEKTRILISALLRRQLRLEYYPVDVCSDALRVAAQGLATEFSRLRVRPLVADYCDGLDGLHALPGQKLVLYLGSSIGNFEPVDAAGVLLTLKAALRPGDALLLGTDMVKASDPLLAAYNDAQGITARFNKNVLQRINRELDADFDLKQFRHVVRWNRKHSRIEMHLKSVRDQVVTISALDQRVSFAAGETIHTENSYKYTHGMITAVLRGGGFRLEQSWTDRRRWFSVHLARAV